MSFDTPEANGKFKNMFDFPYDLLSDEDGAVSQAYGAAEAGAEEDLTAKPIKQKRVYSAKALGWLIVAGIGGWVLGIGALLAGAPRSLGVVFAWLGMMASIAGVTLGGRGLRSPAGRSRGHIAAIVVHVMLVAWPFVVYAVLV